MKQIVTTLMAVFLLLSTFSSFAQISGTVFRDYNGDGLKSVNEPLASDITVNVYLANSNVPCGTALTSGSTAPNYSITGCGSAAVRVEFVLPNAGNCVQLGIDYSSSFGNDNGSSIQFANGNSSNVNFAVHNPGDYNQGTANVSAYIPVYVSGDPLPVGSTAGAQNWFVGYPYTNSGSPTLQPSQQLDGSIIGSTWGVAYSKQAKKIFTSAFLKRHVGLGVMGTGGIYMLEPTATSFNVTQFYDMDGNGHRTRADATAPAYGDGTSFSIAANNSTITYSGSIDALTGQPSGLGVVGTNVERGLNPNPVLPTYDPAAFDQMGKVGLGDIDISDDGMYLFVMNLYSRKVFRLELNDANNPTSVSNVTSYDIPSTTCNNGEYRPFGLKFYRNKLYIGVVCSAENTGGVAADLNGSVYELNNPTAAASFNTTALLVVPLNYNKSGDYNPWTNNSSIVSGSSYPQPILSDIEITDNGDMVLGIMDRAGHQWGENNRKFLKSSTTSISLSTSGDILLAGLDCTTGSFTLENNGTVTSATGSLLTGSSNTNQGPGGKEFFNDDSPSGDPHDETLLGSIAILKGQGELFLPAYAMSSLSGDAGTLKLSTTNGAYIASSAYNLYYRNSTLFPGIFAKANGLGDIELTGTEAPIEIGNRVWADTNNDGIQDAGELGISGVAIDLYQGSTLVGSTTTDANGNYYFNATNVNQNGATQVEANTAYEIRISTTQGSLSATPTLTSANSDPSSNGDERDSDGSGTGTAIISLTTGRSGENNHSYDFGFSSLPPCTLSAPPSLTVAGSSFGGGSAPQAEDFTLNGGTNLLNENNIAGFNFSSSSEGAFYTICTEISQPLLPLQNPYTHVFNESTNGFTAIQALHIAQIFQASGFNSTTGFGAGNNTVVNFVALQAAIWNAMYDADYSVTAGPFQLVTDNNGARALANTWLSAAQNITTPSVVVHRLHHPTGQDLVMIGDVPPITINPTAPTCAVNNGGMTINGFTAGQRYQYSTGTTFNSGSAIPASITAIPVGGNIVSTLPNTTESYTVRVYDATDDNCFTDRTIHIVSVLCCTNQDAGPDQTTCFMNGNGTATLAANGTGTWTEQSGNPGTSTITNTTLATTTVTNFSAVGTYNYIWTNGGCIDTVSIVVNPNGTVGNYVWSDLNNNGTNDEPITAGINGVTVELWDATTNTLVSSTTTANDGSSNPGYYSFIVCTSGDYKVKLPISNGGNNLTTQTTTAATDNNSDANTSDGFSPTFTITTTGTGTDKDNSTIDAGYGVPVSCGSVGNYVWTDLNNNGTNDEPITAGINGVTVELWDATTNTLVSSTTTANDGSSNPGYYSFTVCTSGDYKVKFPTTNSGNSLTTQTTTSATDNNSDANTSDGFSPTFTITTTGIGTDKDNATIDAGYGVPVSCGSVGNYVWTDLNNNGTNDEPTTAGINGVTVELWVATTNTLVSTTTTANDGSSNPGYYSFTVCTSGDYKVKFPTINSGNNLTTQTSTAATDNNSDANTSDGFSPTFTITTTGTGSDKDNLTIDAGYQNTKACLGNYVWNDLNQDGIQNNNEVGVAGVTVSLINGTSNAILATMTTDAYGYYQFCQLDAGDYKVKFSLPTNYVFTTADNPSSDSTDSDPSSITGLTSNVTLATGDSNMTVDAGIYQPQPTTASVGDRVWFDSNSDGIQNSNEQGVSGVVVTLYNCANPTTPIATTITDANGNYIFENVAPGNYSVQFSAPIGTTFTNQTGSVSTTDNSDVNTSGSTVCFPVTAGDEITYVDAGIVPQTTGTSSLGDKVWNDANQDGIQDPTETGVAGVTVTLYDATGTTPISTTITDGLGTYNFNGLTPGCYVVGFDLPSGYTRTTQGAGTDTAKNSDANATTGMTNQICISAGQNNPTIDAGIYNASNTNSVGDLVWYDVNKNGLQDATEYGYPGVVVTLHNCTTNAIVATTTTNANGNYLFDAIANGDYYVSFGFIPGFSFTSMNADVSGISGTSNSDANPSNGNTACVSLTGNTHITYVDAGIYPGNTRNATSSLGDIVWIYVNANGLQDQGETGVPGVTVNLIDATTNTQLATTITDGLGNYIFTNLLGGNYKVEFTNIPSGFVFTTQSGNIDDATNSDANTTTGMTDAIALGLGEDKLTVDAGLIAPTGTVCLGNYVWIDLDNDGIQDTNEPAVPGVTVKLYDNNTNTVLQVATTNSEGNYLFCGLTNGTTYSVGFENLPDGFEYTSSTGALSQTDNSDANPITGRTTTVTMGATNDLTLDGGIFSPTTAIVGNYVWLDANADGIQDPNESPIPGVLVTLYDNTNTAVASAVTDADGKYLFTNVLPGTYTIGFEGYPSTLIATTKGANPSADDDSNIDPSTNKTDPFTVTAGSSNLTLDAGYKANPIAGLGNYVWNDVNQNGLQDASEPGIAGVRVTLLDPNGTIVLGTAFTDGNGAYSFPNLPVGGYIVQFGQPQGLIPTTQNADGQGLNGAANSDMNITTFKTATITLIAGNYNPNIDAGFYIATILPVVLTDFTVVSTECKAQVYWTTSEEHNSNYFELQRRSETEPVFTTIAKINAKGNTQIVSHYHYEDATLSNGQYDYKLNMVDIDSKATSSEIETIQLDCVPTEEIIVSPNPFTDRLQISMHSSQDLVYTIEIIDITGRVVLSTQTMVGAQTKVVQLDMSSFSSSTYFVRVSSNELTKTFKVNKLK